MWHSCQLLELCVRHKSLSSSIMLGNHTESNRLSVTLFVHSRRRGAVGSKQAPQRRWWVNQPTGRGLVREQPTRVAAGTRTALTVTVDQPNGVRVQRTNHCHPSAVDGSLACKQRISRISLASVLACTKDSRARAKTSTSDSIDARFELQNEWQI